MGCRSNTFYSQSELYSRGWTKKLIARFLGQPDQYRVSAYAGDRSGSPFVYLFAAERVHRAEQDTDCSNRLQRKRLRGEQINRATAKRRDAALQYTFARDSVLVPMIDFLDLVDLAEHTPDAEIAPGTTVCTPARASALFAPIAPDLRRDKTVLRLLVDAATGHEAQFDALKRIVGVRQAERMRDNALLEIIAESYPELELLCCGLMAYTDPVQPGDVRTTWNNVDDVYDFEEDAGNLLRCYNCHLTYPLQVWDDDGICPNCGDFDYLFWSNSYEG